MYILVTYDVNTEEKEGQHRLRKVAKLCEQYGHRVQNSVFEMEVDATQRVVLEDCLQRIISKSKDSIRIYNLGKNYKSKIKLLGNSDSFDINGSLII